MWFPVRYRRDRWAKYQFPAKKTIECGGDDELPAPSVVASPARRKTALAAKALTWILAKRASKSAIVNAVVKVIQEHQTADTVSGTYLGVLSREKNKQWQTEDQRRLADQTAQPGVRGRPVAAEACSIETEAQWSNTPSCVMSRTS